MQTPGQRWAGRFPQKQVSRRRRDLQWKRARPRVTWLGSGRGPRKSSGLRDGAPRSGSCGNRLRGRRGGSRQPGTCSSPPKEAAGTAERGRGTGRGASPGRARLSSLLGRAAPPRPAPPPPPSSPRAEQPARRAAGSGSASEPAAACGRAAGGAVSQPRSWNLKGQAPRGRGVCAPAKGTRDSRRVRPRRGAPGGPAAKFPAGMAGERPRPASAASPECRAQAARREQEGFLFLSLGGQGGNDLYAQQVLHLFSAALVSVPGHRLFSPKAQGDKWGGWGRSFLVLCQNPSRNSWVWRKGGGGKIQLSNILGRKKNSPLPFSVHEASPFPFWRTGLKVYPTSSPASSDSSPSRRHLFSTAINASLLLLLRMSKNPVERSI